jgi:two-component system chemotaxis response regulator CheY
MCPTKRTALVCDDDSLTRQLVSRLLDDAGYEILAELDTAVGVVEVARLSKPSVIVLDLSLPGISGVAAVPELRKASPVSRIIVCTSFDNLGEEARLAGVHAVVSKSELLSLVDIIDGLARV